MWRPCVAVELVELLLPEPLLPDTLVVTAGVVLVELLLAGITLLMAGVVLLVELPVSTEPSARAAKPGLPTTKSAGAVGELLAKRPVPVLAVARSVALMMASPLRS